MNQVNSDRLNGEVFIDFKEFFWRLAEQWKAIVVVALIVMLAFSSASYVLTSAGENTEDSEFETQEEVLESLSVNDREMVVSVLREKAARDKLQEYIKNSPYMNLDPYRVNTVNMTWLITSEETINRQLVAAYVNELASYKLADAVNKAWGSPYNSENIRELLVVKSNIPVNTEAELNGNLITITLYVPGENDGKVAIDAINEVVTSVNTKLTGAIGAHEIQALTSELTVTSDLTLAEEQFSHYSRFYNISNQLNSFNKILTEGQNEAYALISQFNEAVDPEDQEDIVMPNRGNSSPFSKKNLLIGFIMGIFLYIIVYFIYFALSGKISSPAGVEGSFGVRTLGEWNSGERKGLLGFLKTDKFIYKRHHRGHLNQEAELTKVSESISSGFNGEEGGKILLVSSAKSGNATKEFMSLLSDKLKESGIETGNTEVDYSEGISVSERFLSEFDGAAFVADKNTTAVKEIRDTASKCGYCSKPSAGVVYTD